MLLLCVAAVLLSGGHAASLTCHDLVKPLDNVTMDMVLGRWTLVGATMDSMENLDSKELTRVGSFTVWVEAKLTSPDSNNISFIYTKNMYSFDVQCSSPSFQINMTLANNTLQIAERVPPMLNTEFRLTAVYLKTNCSDCLLVKYSLSVGLTHVVQGLQFLSRRQELTHAELETFQNQVECLKMPRPVIFSTQTNHQQIIPSLSELCPQQPPVDAMEWYIPFLKGFATAFFTGIKAIDAVVDSIGTAIGTVRAGSRLLEALGKKILEGPSCLFSF